MNRTRPFGPVLATATFAMAGGCGAARFEAPSSPASSPVIRFNAADIPWTDAPPGLPAGAKTAVLEGDPRKPGAFTMRLRLPAGARLNPHTHPADERVTVLSGSVRLGWGEKFDATRGKTFTAGAFYITPTPMPHFVWADEECVLQVTGQGPWGLTYIDAADAARVHPH